MEAVVQANEPNESINEPSGDNLKLASLGTDFDAAALSQQSWDMLRPLARPNQANSFDIGSNNYRDPNFNPFAYVPAANLPRQDRPLPYYQQSNRFFTDQANQFWRVQPRDYGNNPYLSRQLDNQQFDDQTDSANLEYEDLEDGGEETRPADQFEQPNRTEKPDYTGKRIVEVRPGESIQKAIDNAPEGSVVRVMAGVYNEQINIKRDNIILEGDGKAILDLSGKQISEGAIQIKNRSNVTISGFEIRNVAGGDTPTGIHVEGAGNNIRILNCDIHHVSSNKNAHAINVVGTSSTPIKGLVIDGNKIHDLKLGSSEAVTINGNVDGFRVTNNDVYNANNIGIDITGGYRVAPTEFDRARNGLIADNRVRNIDSRNNPAYKGSMAAGGIYVDGGSDVTIERNTVTNSNYGIELAAERKNWNTTNITVRNNVLVENHMAGLSMGGANSSNGGVTGSLVENNRFIRNGTVKNGSEAEIWLQTNVSSNTIGENFFESKPGVKLIHGLEKNPNNRIAASLSRTRFSRLEQ